MKPSLLFLPVVIMCSFLAPAQNSADSGKLDAVLKKMDTVATNFHSAQADFEWDIYQRAIDEVMDVEFGTIYYRKTAKGVEMMASVSKDGPSKDSLKPEPKFILFSDNKVQLYQPKADQVTVVDLGKGHSDYESYVVLGFGGSGQEMLKSFDVSYVGTETLDGVATAKLKLEPKSEKVRNTYSYIFLWIDTDKGISVQQQLFQPQGDYKLAKYSNIQINGKKIPDDVFKLKTTSKTQFVSPGG